VTADAPARPLLDLVEATLKRQGRTKTWLASRSGVSRATINNWAHQPRTPQSSSVLAIANVLGIDQEHALRLAGLLNEATATRTDTIPDLSEVPTATLVAELHRIGDELARRIPD
jgi:transcriptional regulator with XRE-family HTH domain